MSDKDFNRYIENALGSINKTAAGLDISHEQKMITTESFAKFLQQAESITKQLGVFSKKLISPR